MDHRVIQNTPAVQLLKKFPAEFGIWRAFLISDTLPTEPNFSKANLILKFKINFLNNDIQIINFQIISKLNFTSS